MRLVQAVVALALLYHVVLIWQISPTPTLANPATVRITT